MVRLSVRQWQLLVAVVVVGVLMQVAWLLMRSDPPRHPARPAPASGSTP
jgi:hypothetical protein